MIPRVTAVGLDEMQQTLQRLNVFMEQDLARGVMDEALAILLDKNRKRFLSEVDPEGNPWVESFAAIRRRQRGVGGGTLFDTGRLFNSIQAVNNKNFTGVLETDVPYAEQHQEGKGQVQRRFLGINPADEAIITRLIDTRLQEAAGV